MIGTIGLVLFVVGMFGSIVWFGVLPRIRMNNWAARAKVMGPLLRYRTHDGVTALCLESDFQRAYQGYLQDVEDKKRKASDKVSLWVSETFTFYDFDRFQTMMHTGSKDDKEALIELVMSQALGMTKRSFVIFDYTDWMEVQNYLVVFDERLFVPFAGGMSKLAEQEKFYRRFDMKYTIQYVLERVIVAVENQKK